MAFAQLLLALIFTTQCVLFGNAERYGAFIVFSRTLEPSSIVEGRNVTVTYELHNIGTGAAQRVTLRDNAFPQSWYTIHDGSFRKTWDLIEPGKSEFFSVVATPSKFGELNVNVPTVTYQENDGTRRVSQLDAESTVVVEDILSYKRRTDKHVKDWVIYTLGSAAATALPYYIYFTKMQTLSGKDVKKQ